MQEQTGELNGYYDLRVGLGSGLSWKEAISRAIRDCFLRNDGKLSKKLMDKTIQAVGKHNPRYHKAWREFKQTFEITVVGGRYINPFHPA